MSSLHRKNFALIKEYYRKERIEKYGPEPKKPRVYTKDLYDFSEIMQLHPTPAEKNLLRRYFN